MFNLKNKVVLVTGSRRGIGRGIAEVFAEAGAKVAISDLDLADCQKTAKQIAQKYKVKTTALKCDVSNKTEIDETISQVVKKFGKLDILVNNAGIFFAKPLLEYTEEDWDKTIDINLKSVEFGTQAAAKVMKTGGKIINIASIAGLAAYPQASSYCASKGGIISLTKELSLELAPQININAIAPGAIDTPMTSFMKKDKKVLKQTLAGIPKARMGKPKDIGYAVLFLASVEADYITGQTLVVDGGWTAGL